MSSAFVPDGASGLLSKLDQILAVVRRRDGVIIRELSVADANALLTAYYHRTDQPYLVEENATTPVAPQGETVFWGATDESFTQLGVIGAAGGASEIERVCAGAGVAVPDTRAFAEIKRFVTLPATPNPGVALGLMTAATRWCVRNEYQGFLALTRLLQSRLFARFGLTRYVETSFVVAERRGGEYWLLHAEWPAIERAADQCLRTLAGDR